MPANMPSSPCRLHPHSFSPTHLFLSLSKCRHQNYSVHQSSPNSNFHLRNSSKPKAWSRSIKNTIISIEKHITVNILSPTSHTLQRSKTAASTSSSEVQKTARDRSITAPNLETQCRKSSGTREDIPSLRAGI